MIFEKIEPGDIVHIDDGYGAKGHYYVVLDIDTKIGTIEALQITSTTWDYDDYTSIGPTDHSVIARISRIKNEVYEFDYDRVGRNFGPLSERAIQAVNEMELRWG